MINIKAIKAKSGDCILLTVGKIKVLIDGGPTGVYKASLKPVLEEISQADENSEPVKLDLVMVSHIDSDHIGGIQKMLDELDEAELEGSAKIATIKEIWHNSFSDDILKDVETPVAQGDAATASSDLLDAMVQGLQQAENPILSSVKQGRNLKISLDRLRIKTNSKFKNRIVTGQSRKQPWEKGGFKFTVIGPGEEELEDLRTRWVRDLKVILSKAEEAKLKAAAIALDTSLTNLASIVVVAEAGKHRVLLTGDARGDMIGKWLGQSSFAGNTHFDVMKLPHHGSSRNVSVEFFKEVTADHYIVSGDGNHGNPDAAMFEMLFTARPSLDYKIHLTYAEDELRLRKHFNGDEYDRVFKDRQLGESRTNVLKPMAPNTKYLEIALG